MSLRHEHRLHPRRHTMIAAEIVYSGRRKPCIIRNISDGGAKLEFTGVADIPQHFVLAAPGHHPQACEVRWRALRELGVQFIQIPEVAASA